jgi:hypothetical protein
MGGHVSASIDTVEGMATRKNALAHRISINKCSQFLNTLMLEECMRWSKCIP